MVFSLISYLPISGDEKVKLIQLDGTDFNLLADDFSLKN